MPLKTACSIRGMKMKRFSTKKLAETVKRCRRERQMTQSELAQRSGIHRSMLGRLENEDYKPSLDQLDALAELLGFDAAKTKDAISIPR